MFTGFPWDLPGETWEAGSAPSQAASVVGAYGLTWVTIAIAASPSVLLQSAVSWRARVFALTLAAASLAGLYGFGHVKLEAAAKPRAGAPVIRVVQANIDQKEKWRPGKPRHDPKDLFRPECASGAGAAVYRHLAGGGASCGY